MTVTTFPPWSAGLSPVAATVTIGSVTSLPPGSPPTVTNVGTPSAAVLNFGIPDSGGGGGGGVTDGDKGDIVVSSSGTVWSIDGTVLSTFGRSLIDDADAAAARTTLGLGTAATQASTAFAAASHTHAAGDVTSGTFAPTRLPIFSDVAAGAVPASGGGTANFLRADGAWALPPGGGGGGAPVDATYLTLTTNGTLTAERTIAFGSGLSGADGGAGAAYTISLDADLSAIAALSTTGFPARTAADTWALRSLTAPAAGITITNPAGVAGNPTFALANDLAAVEGLAANGIAVRTAADTWAVRSIAAPAAGITITNGDGVAGNPTLALANDLGAVEGLTGTGIIRRTGPDTWSAGTLVSFGELTNVATAAEYRSNTASRLLAAAPVWSAADLVALTDGATIAMDLATGINFSVTLAGTPRTLGTPSNPKVGQTGLIFITQDATGGRTLSLGTNWAPIGGVTPSLVTTANVVNVWGYAVRSTTSIVVWNIGRL